MMKTATEFLVIQEEVRDALASGQAVVALESTIIAHGMPYPQNVETAKQVEAVVRAQGAVPATIAVLGGKICIGLSEEQLQHLGQSGHVMKVSRRDLPYVVSQGLDGATTVSATMIGASLAGVSVFVTGGIGGVHRGAQETFDISADLTELARTKVAVVCAGAKSILDIGLTLEYLETQGVPVIGYGTDDFPAFYARSSGFKADCRLDSPEEVAALLRAKWALGLEGGAVVANPIPEAQAMAWEPIEAATQQALAEASEQGVSGKRLTPFLLARIKSLTGGESLEANIALVKNNAAVGGQLAVALAKLG